jgi:hypothetical protein
MRFGIHDTSRVGRAAACYNQRRPATGAFRVKGGRALCRPVHQFEPHMHRRHEDAVLQCRSAKDKRFEEVRIVATGHGDAIIVPVYVKL